MKNELTLIAGSRKGFRDGQKRSAQFSGISDICYLAEHDQIYLSDSTNHRIRKIDRYGTVTTFAGWRDSQVCTRLKFPKGICYVKKRNCFYICDAFNNRIVSIDAMGRVVTVAGRQEGLKDGKGEDAQFYYPCGICYCELTDCLYVSDFFNFVIREIDSEFKVRTVAGSRKGMVDGYGENVKFNGPTTIIFIEEHDCFYICDTGNHRIRKMDLGFNVTTVAGSDRGWNDGLGESAMFDCPNSICYVPVDDSLYVADYKNVKLRKIDSDFNVTTVNLKDNLAQNLTNIKGICYDEDSDRLIFSGSDIVIKMHLAEPLESNVETKRRDLIAAFFEEKKNTDFILKTKNGETDAHTFLLSCRMGSDFSNLISRDLSFKTTDILLKYCYKDIVEETNLETLVEMDQISRSLGMDHLSTLIHSKIIQQFPEIQVDVEYNLFRPDAQGESSFDCDMEKIFLYNYYSDISITVTDICEEKSEFHGHKAIVLYQSDYFNAFFSFQKDNPTYTHTTSLSMNAFSILFNSWYFKYPDMKTISLEDLIYLLVWGPMYLSRNTDLFEHCFRYFKRNIRLHGTTEIQSILEKFSIPMLKNLLQLDYLDFLYHQIVSIITEKQANI